ncbi:MAG: GTP-binding protein [Pseudomonadota bacterium]
MIMKDNHAPPDGAVCDVVLIAGFLGAGKTTLLRNILRWPGDLSGTAILVNEFGRIGIDGDLLRGFNTPVYELTNGCICCTIQGDFINAISEMLDRFHPRRLFIEATGVADPFEILTFLKSSQIVQRISTPRVVTVLAGDLWEGREYFGPLFYNQIKAAELLLFNKVDLLPKEEVSQSVQEIKKINPSCSVMPTHHCEIDPEVLLRPVVGTDHEPGSHVDHPHSGHGTADEMGYVSFAFEAESPLEADCFYRFIKDLPAGLYRVKGFVLLEDRRFLVNHVGGKTEWVEVDEMGPTKLAFVGWQVNEGHIIEALNVCLKGPQV